LSGHHPTRPGFEAACHQGVIGGSDADKAVESRGPSGRRRSFDVPIGKAHMLVVDPESVKASVNGEHLNHIGMEQAADRENNNLFAVREAGLQRRHEGVPLGEGSEKFNASIVATRQDCRQSGESLVFVRTSGEVGTGSKMGTR